MTYYIFTADERAVKPDDLCVATRYTIGAAKKIAQALDQIETYIMDESDRLVWFSWPDIDAAIAASRGQ